MQRDVGQQLARPGRACGLFWPRMRPCTSYPLASSSSARYRPSWPVIPVMSARGMRCVASGSVFRFVARPSSHSGARHNPRSETRADTRARPAAGEKCSSHRAWARSSTSTIRSGPASKTDSTAWASATASPLRADPRVGRPGHLGQRPGVGDDERRARRHRLGDHEPERLGPLRREDRDVDGGEEVLARDPARAARRGARPAPWPGGSGRCPRAGRTVPRRPAAGGSGPGRCGRARPARRRA